MECSVQARVSAGPCAFKLGVGVYAELAVVPAERLIGISGGR
jgi:hypothetical protein